MKYYQLMSGDSTRDFSRVMLDFGTALVGPGRYGSIIENQHVYEEKGHWGKLAWLLEASPGDRIVLHAGKSQIQAVGEIIESNGQIYQYSPFFSDIDGWDLNHFCFVRWKLITKTFDDAPLSRSTAQRLHKEEVIKFIEDNWDSYSFVEPRYEMTQDAEELTYEQIEDELIDSGLRIEDAEQTVKTMERVEKLAKWYLKQDDDFPKSEHEIRSFVVIPFLYSLGWSHQRMSVEYGNLDIVLFSDASRTEAKIFIETKSLWTGSVKGLQQAKGYLVSKPELLRNIEKVIITDGLVYWLFNAGEMDNPIAYMNLGRRRSKNPAYPEVGGLMAFIKSILP